MLAIVQIECIALGLRQFTWRFVGGVATGQAACHCTKLLDGNEETAQLINLLWNFVGVYAVSKVVKNFNLNGKTVPKVSITERQVQDPELMKSPIKTVYDVVDVPNHYILRLVFRVYDYYWVQFNYDNGLCGFSIDLCNEFGASLESKIRSYMGTKDWDSYLKEIMAEIELRIPDEYLKAKVWL